MSALKRVNEYFVKSGLNFEFHVPVTLQNTAFCGIIIQSNKNKNMLNSLFSEHRLVFLSAAPKPEPQRQETKEAAEKPSLKIKQTPEALKTEVERTRDSIKTLKEHIAKRAEKNPALKKILAKLDKIDGEFYRLTQSGEKKEKVKWDALVKIQDMMSKPGSEVNKERIAVAKNILDKSVGDIQDGNAARLLDLAFLLKSDGSPITAKGMSVERRGHHIVLKYEGGTSVFQMENRGNEWNLSEINMSGKKRIETPLGNKKTEGYTLGGLYSKPTYESPFYLNRSTATKDVYDYSHMAKPKTEAKKAPEKKAAPKAPETKEARIVKSMTELVKTLKANEKIPAPLITTLDHLAKILQNTAEKGGQTSFSHENVKFQLSFDHENIRVIFPKESVLKGQASTQSEYIYSIRDKKFLGGKDMDAFVKSEMIADKWIQLEQKVDRLKPGQSISFTVTTEGKENKYEVKKTQSGYEYRLNGKIDDKSIIYYKAIYIATGNDYRIVTPQKTESKRQPENVAVKKGSPMDLLRRATFGTPEKAPEWKTGMKQQLETQLTELNKGSVRTKLNQEWIAELKQKYPNKPKLEIYQMSGDKVAKLISGIQWLSNNLDSQNYEQTQKQLGRIAALIPSAGETANGIKVALKLTPEKGKAEPKQVVAEKGDVKFDKVTLKDWPTQLQNNVANVIRGLIKHPDIYRIFSKQMNEVAALLLKKPGGSDYLHAVKQQQAVRKLFQDIYKNSFVKRTLRQNDEKPLLEQINKLALTPYPPEPKNPTAEEGVQIAKIKKDQEVQKKFSIRTTKGKPTT